MIIIPCHRVIGKSGDITGYAGGIKIKEKLIELEKNNNNKIQGNSNIDMIKVLSIIEPWATLIKEKKKYIETRTWKIEEQKSLYI